MQVLIMYAKRDYAVAVPVIYELLYTIEFPSFFHFFGTKEIAVQIASAFIRGDVAAHGTFVHGNMSAALIAN